MYLLRLIKHPELFNDVIDELTKHGYFPSDITTKEKKVKYIKHDEKRYYVDKDNPRKIIVIRVFEFDKKIGVNAVFNIEKSELEQIFMYLAQEYTIFIADNFISNVMKREEIIGLLVDVLSKLEKEKNSVLIQTLDKLISSLLK